MLIEEEGPKTKLFLVLASHVINHPENKERGKREEGERGDELFKLTFRLR